ncbi:hypothetical protein Ddye_008131 [Dipteronia dyeriana]|uniref:DUF1985 domain-containing protein n=1 Tax=Dipteronia dyeriana TaxID=168575 RepID=A0AAD9X930_9ROSI|nr:hypothetical protein Ddye_008131 [Dipteronia dyeriana]
MAKSLEVGEQWNFETSREGLQSIEMRNHLKELLKTPEVKWYEGKLTRHDHFDTLGSIDDTLNRVLKEFTVEEHRRFMESYFGHFMSMHRQMKFSGGIIHQLFLQELHHNGSTDEMWFMLGNHEVRFSKVEFCLITGLRFGVVSDTTLYASMDNGIHQLYFGGIDEVLFEELRVVLNLNEFQQLYNGVNLCLLYMLN